MEDEKDDDFMCMRVDDGRTITTYKGVTVVASKRTEQGKSQNKETVNPKSWWQRVFSRFH